MNRPLTALTCCAAVLAVVACSKDRGTPVDVVIHFPGPSPTLSKAVMAVDYSATGARPDGGRTPACTSLLPFVDAGFSDNGSGVLTVEVRSAGGFSPPVDLIACRMLSSEARPDGARIQQRLQVRVQSAVDIAGQDVGDKRLASLSNRVRSRSTVHESSRSSAAQARRERSESQARERERRAAEAAELAGAAPARPNTPGSARFSGNNSDRTIGRIDTSRFETPPSEPIERRGAASNAPGAFPAAPPPPAGGGGPIGDGGDGGLDSGGNVDEPVGRVEPDSVLPTSLYEVTLSVLSSSGDLGALQIEVDFTGASGGFVGKGNSIECTPFVAQALTAFNRQNQTMIAGFISTNGIATPGPIAACNFKSREAVNNNSFDVRVTDASDTDSQPAKPPPFVGVSDVRLIR